MSDGASLARVLATLGARLREFERQVATIAPALSPGERAEVDARLDVLRRMTKLVWSCAPDDPARRN